MPRLGALAIAIAVGSLAPVPPGKRRRPQRAPRPHDQSMDAATHADGQPDPQGVWLNNSATPLSDPKALEGKPFLTDDEDGTETASGAVLPGRR
jgi:hypothetical protein